MTDQKKQYTIEVSEGEAERIERGAKIHGVTPMDYVLYCVRALSFDVNYAIRMLAKLGQSGTRED